MKTTVSDIRNQQFGKAFRGYTPEEVHIFLNRIALEWDAAVAENKALERRSNDLEAQVREFRAMETGLQQTILQTQEASIRALDSARREAQLMIREAETKASELLDKARNELLEMKEQLAILRARKNSIASRFKTLLSSELELIKSLDADDKAQQEAGREERQEVSSERLEIEEIIRSLDR
ncbi:MAG: DivIVA domain-containing protein [Ignavibacteria bacterium]|nr:MAG: DivIVA domain-containing protein [Ignavibacteria bacterium]